MPTGEEDIPELSDEEIESLFEEDLKEEPVDEEGVSGSPETAVKTGPEEPTEISEEEIDVSDLPDNVKRVLDIKVPLIAILARKKMTLQDVLSIHTGMVLELDKPLAESLNLCIGDQEIAEGETVKVGERFGLRVKKIKSPREKLELFQAFGGEQVS